MPRGVPRNKETKKKENILKANQAEVAEPMLKMLDEIMKVLEADLLKQLASHPASDIEETQQEYKACHKIAEKLRSKISDGKIAVSKLRNEEV